MGEFRRIDDRVSVAPQISVADVGAARDAGFVCIVNNRPDGEAPDEPQGAEIAAACAEAGLTYHAIPVAGGFSPEQAAALRDVIDGANGPVLAYCRSGTRSCFLWALSEALAGDDTDEIAAKASAAGYDVTPLLNQVGR
ncbi:Beta-lactamase hydrolase-like protein phosphatase-like domain-containing protein [Sphingomonas antarctica]|uniref:TIGR01244 family sulfur transferase n=1 Tax=Sphingomonas antarctica TaxID=2040274 RepID=UPI0039E79969